MNAHHYIRDRTSRQHGVSKITVLIFGGLLAAAVFSAYRIIPFYYYYYELENQMRALTRVASTHTDLELRKRITRHMRKMQIPADPEDVKIERDGDRIRMKLKYKEVFYVTLWDKDYDLYEFDFAVNIDEPIHGS